MLEVIYAAIIILALLIAGLLLSLLGHNLQLTYREKRYLKLREEWEPLLFAYLEGEVDLAEAARGFAGKPHYVWRFIRTYLDNLRGTDHTRLESLLEETGFTAYQRRKLETGARKDRLEAAVILGKIGDAAALPTLKKMLYSDVPEEIIAAGKAISEIGEMELLFAIVRAFLTRTYITFEGISQILIVYGDKICPLLTDKLAQWLQGEVDLEEEFGVPSYQPAALFVELLGHKRYTGAVPILAQILEEVENEELIIQVFKALARIKRPVQADLTSFLRHDNWVIRSQATRYLYKCWQDRYVNELIKRLTDPNWWVSFYAGLALFHNGRQRLLQELAAGSGPGSEVCQYILEAGGDFEHF